MSGLELSSIVLGHNAFFGVDHLSASRGSARAAAFAEPERILDMIRHAMPLGAGGMMMSTHERAAPVAELLRADKALAQDFKLYPLLPYAQKYITQANEKGLVNVVMDSISGGGLKDKASMMWKGGKSLLTKDINAALGALIHLELRPFQGLNVPAVFLHDALTDLALGLGLKNIFQFYIEEMETAHDTVGSFATKNLPMLLDRFSDWNLPAPVVLTHFNKAGYHMNPDRLSCEQAARDHNVHIMAMGTLSSGFLKPDEAYEYLGGVSNIESVVVGVSSPEHARETFEAIRRHLPAASATSGA